MKRKRTIRPLAMGIIFLFISTGSIPIVDSLSIERCVSIEELVCESNSGVVKLNDNPMDYIEITSEGTFWLMAILRGDVFTTKITNKNNIFYRYAIKIWVEKPSGSTILGPYEDLYIIEPHSLVRYHLCDFYDFREAGYLFGFFYVYCELTITYGFTQYSVTERFPGFIWVISARILNENGKIIE